MFTPYAVDCSLRAVVSAGFLMVAGRAQLVSVRLRRPVCLRFVWVRRRPRVLVPAILRRGPKASTCSAERVADGRWVAAAAALCGGDAIGVESVRDRGQAVAGCSLAPDPLDRVRGHARGPAEPDALRAFARRAPVASAARSGAARTGRRWRAGSRPAPRRASSVRGCSRARRAPSTAAERSPVGRPALLLSARQ